MVIKTLEKPKKKCRTCGKILEKPYKYSLKQWSQSKYCSYKCSAESKRIRDGMSKGERFRRKKGILIKGSPELKEKISYLTKLAMQRPEVQKKIRQPKGAQSLERRMYQSNKMKGIMPKNLMYDNSSWSHIQRGYYDINGTTIYFRSKWEANYALFLDFLIDHKEIVKWEFEPDTFMFEAIKLGTRSYTPDFKVFNNDKSIEYHEVKGYMDSRSKTKLKRMKKYYPKIVLKLIDSSEYNLLKKQIGGLCKFY